MQQISHIAVTHDPKADEAAHRGIPHKDEEKEISLAKIIEKGESFFAPGFMADVYLTDGQSFTFLKTAGGHWEYRYEEDGQAQVRQAEGSFTEALNILLIRVNLYGGAD